MFAVFVRSASSGPRRLKQRTFVVMEGKTFADTASADGHRRGFSCSACHRNPEQAEYNTTSPSAMSYKGKRGASLHEGLGEGTPGKREKRSATSDHSPAAVSVDCSTSSTVTSPDRIVLVPPRIPGIAIL